MGRKAALRTLFAALALSAVLAASAMAFDFTEFESQVSTHKLSNGLTILVMERHDAPVASFVTWADVGSADDPKGYTGLAHMFEHMAFKGTTTLGTKDIKQELVLIAKEDSLFMLLRAERNKGMMVDSTRLAQLEEAYEAAREASYQLVKPNELGNIIDREGGVGLNAGTAKDFTVYFYSLPSNKVELWMALESERFYKPVLREMYKERDVVAEERRMRYESNPIGNLFEDFLTLAYRAHPYGVPGIGHMSDIQYYSRQEAQAFFEKYYVPSNLVIAIVGDVIPKDIFKMAEKYFGRIPKSPKPSRIATIEPEQRGERRTVHVDQSQPFYIAGWHIPEGSHPDRPALDALADYLGQGRTSILYKDIVKERKLAIDVACFTGFPGDKYPTMMIAYAVPAQGSTALDVEKEILAGAERIKEELIPAEEVEKIKARVKANFVRQLTTNSGIAQQIAYYQTMYGDFRQLFRDVDRMNAVTAEDIQRVANKYLTQKNRTVAYIETSES